MNPVDAVDRKIIQATQAGLPLVADPYRLIADQLALPVAELMQRLRKLQINGVIRRIGVVPNHYKLGYRYNGMTVWNVKDDVIDEMGTCVGQLDFVSHCYHRPRHLPDWPYNLFAMIHSKTEQDAERQIAIIADILGEAKNGHEVLFSTRILKKTGLRIGQ